MCLIEKEGGKGVIKRGYLVVMMVRIGSRGFVWYTGGGRGRVFSLEFLGATTGSTEDRRMSLGEFLQGRGNHNSFSLGLLGIPQIQYSFASSLHKHSEGQHGRSLHHKLIRGELLQLGCDQLCFLASAHRTLDLLPQFPHHLQFVHSWLS